MAGADPKKTRTHNVNLQGLEVFCEVVRLRSFSRGAEAVGITQSAASQLVAHLEEALGLKLIDRRQRPLRPTAEGQQYYQGCRQMLHGYAAMVDRVQRQNNAGGGSVRVVSIYSVGLHTLSPRVQRFLQENAGSTVRLGYYHPVKVYGAVLDNEAEVGVVSYPKSVRQLEVIPWIEEEMVVACPPDHPLAESGPLADAGKPSIELSELEGAGFVAFDADLQIRREIDKKLKQKQVTVQILSEFDNIETIKQALEISHAVSILPRPTVLREVERGNLVELHISDVDLRRPVGIVHKKRPKLTPTAELFIDSLRAEATAS